jgi:hypothetical protein
MIVLGETEDKLEETHLVVQVQSLATVVLLHLPQRNYRNHSFLSCDNIQTFMLAQYPTGNNFTPLSTLRCKLFQ